MTTEDTSPASRYLTLRDYLRVLRRYRMLIAVIAIVGAVAGLADALSQTAVYQATAEVAFQDPTQALGLVGLASSSAQAPAQLAAVNADTATAPNVMATVRRRLKTSIPAEALAGAVSTQVAVASGLLQIGASSSSPVFAVRLSNAVADQLVAQDNARTQAQFAQLSRNIRRRIAALTGTPGAHSPAAGQLAFYEDELGRLDALGAFTKGAQVVKVAQPPAAAISPHKTRSVLIGLALGLLLGLIAAFFRDSLDRRLRSGQDMETLLNLPVVGHAREHILGRVPQVSNGSRDDYRIDLESFRILRRNLDFLDRERTPRSILVTSALPEEGKTTVAASLAFSMAAAGRRTLLVDCDLRRPALAERLGIAQTPGLSDYLCSEVGPPEVVRTVGFNDPPPAFSQNGNTREASSHSLAFIPSGSRTPLGAELLGSARFKEFLEEVTEAYDVVILDSSPLLPVADTLEMLPNVDAVLLCARESRTTRDQAIAARATLARFPERPAGLVVTGVTAQSEPYGTYAYVYDYA
jgi:Mrp family chromosome partitioning ATPase